MNSARQTQRCNDYELQRGITVGRGSWHDEFKNSSYIYVGNLDDELTEGDILSVFSQYGEILHINLVKQPDSNLSRGFAFLGYEDQRSTVLAVDNLNGVELVGKVLRVNHAKDYSPRDKDGESTLYNAAPNMDRLSSGSSASHHIRPYSNERSHVKDDPHGKNSREASASFRSDTLTVRERQTESYTSRRYSSRNHSRERSRSPSPRMDRDQTRYYRSRTNRPRSSATRSRDQQPEQSRARSTSGEAARERQLKTLR